MARATAGKRAYAASIEPRARLDGTLSFDVRFRHNGSSKSRSFKSREFAERWKKLLEVVGPDEALANLNGVKSDITVDDLLEKFIDSRTGVQPKHLTDIRTAYESTAKPIMGSLPVDAVSKRHIEQWVKVATESGRAAKTIENHYGSLASMFKWAHAEGIIVTNPCADKPKLPQGEREPIVFLTTEEFEMLLRCIPERSRPLVLFLVSTGLRWGEATALQPRDIDLRARELRVERSWKYAKGRSWYLGPPKTKKGRRAVTFPDELAPILKELMRSGNEFLFVNRDGAPIRQQKFAEEVWQPALRVANGLPAKAHARGNKDRPWTPRAGGTWDIEPATEPLGKWPRVHDLRHTHASWLIAAGTPLTVIQHRLGHESIKTTSDTYGHVYERERRLAAEATSQALGSVFASL